MDAQLVDYNGSAPAYDILSPLKGCDAESWSGRPHKSITIFLTGLELASLPLINTANERILSYLQVPTISQPCQR